MFGEFDFIFQIWEVPVNGKNCTRVVDVMSEFTLEIFWGSTVEKIATACVLQIYKSILKALQPKGLENQYPNDYTAILNKLWYISFFY